MKQERPLIPIATCLKLRIAASMQRLLHEERLSAKETDEVFFWICIQIHTPHPALARHLLLTQKAVIIE
jgi:hypothetical protein